MTPPKDALTADLDGVRLDAFVADKTELSRSAAANLLNKGLITVNGKPALKSLKIKKGDVIRVEYPKPEPLEAVPENIPLDIIYEDDWLLVVDKPKGMVTHPAPGNYTGTLVNALLYHCEGGLSGINGALRPGIVHRIDKDTSGLLLVAKNDEAHRSLSSQIEAHACKREYEGVVIGRFKTESGTIDAPIGRSPSDRKKRAVNGINAKNAVTHYETVEILNGFSCCRFKLETGRTHQIRVHASYMGHPLAGDTVYGDKKRDYGLSGQCLHARSIGFIHPETGEYMEFSSDLPKYFTDFLEKIRKP